MYVTQKELILCIALADGAIVFSIDPALLDVYGPFLITKHFNIQI